METDSKCAFTNLEDKISERFANYGRFACRHPVPLIIIPILVYGGLGVGLLRLRLLSDTEQVYTPMNSQAKQDKEKTLSIFPDSSEFFQRHHLVTLGRYVEVIGRLETTNDNILRDTTLDEIVRLNDYLVSLKVTIDDGIYTYEDVCTKAMENCVISGGYLLTAHFKDLVRAGNVSYPTIPTYRPPAEVDGFLGDLTVSEGTVTKARYFKLRYNLREDRVSEAQVTALEDKFIEELGKYESSTLELAYSMSRSLTLEVDASVKGDVTLFSLTFTWMITYVSMISYTDNMVASHANLSRLGVVSTGLGLLGGLGLVCAIGVAFVPIVGSTPFLILGVGIDDVFVLLSGLADTYEEGMGEQAVRRKGVEERIIEMMKTSGVAVTLTTLTNVLALVIGAFSVFLVVRNFCIFTGACFLLAYFSHMTFLTGMIVLHVRRVEESRHELLCSKEIVSAEEAEERSFLYRLFCTGSKPESRNEAENLAEKIPRMIMTKIISLLPARILIAIAFVVSVVVGIWGTALFESGLELSQLTVDGSYFQTYDKWVNAYFKRFEVVTIVFESPLDYRSDTVQVRIEQMIDHLKRERITGIDDDFDINWLADYKASPTYNGSSSEIFMQNLRTLFLRSNPHFENDIVLSGESIIASRVFVRTKDLKTSERQAASLAKIRGILSDYDLPVYAISPGAVFYEQYLAVKSSTAHTVGMAIVVVFAVMCVFMPSPTLIIYVTLTLTFSMVEIFGFMHFWGLKLSSITMIHIIMSVGFSVDYESHICHAYLAATGRNRRERVMNALQRASGPITHGTISSMLGLLTLIFSKSFVFRSFFKVMTLVIVFGFGHSLFVIPTFLYYSGPRPSLENGRTEAIAPTNERIEDNT